MDIVNESVGHSRRRSKLLGAIVLLVAGALLAACTSSAPGGSSPSGAARVKVGIIGYSAADATLNKTAEEIVAQAKALGWDTDYQAANPAGDVTNANSLMGVMVGKGSTMLITIAFDPNQLGTGIAAAKAKGVSVLAMSAGKLAPGVIWASDVGYVPDMGDIIKKDFADAPKGEILNLTYLSATPGQGRNKLIQEVAKNNPQIHLTDQEVAIPGAIQSGRDSTTAWLAAHPAKPGIKLAIYAVFDQPASGAVAALKQAGRTDVKIYSYDATPAGLALIKEGYIVADVQNGRKLQATQAIEAAQRVVSGKLTQPEIVPAAFFIVTTSNVAKYEKDFPAAFTAEGV